MQIHNITPASLKASDNKNVSFKGSGFQIRPKRLIETLFSPERKGNMSRNLFIVTAFTFLLSGRLIKSRDENEKREVLIRDVPTFIIAVQGVPLIGKQIAKYLQRKSGFAILDEQKINHDSKWLQLPESIMKRKETQKVLSTSEQLSDWYIYKDSLKSGIEGFLGRLESKGGDLKKIIASLDLGDKVNGFFDSYKGNKADLISELVKDGRGDIIKEAFKNPKNKAYEIAEFKRTTPKIAGFLLTLATIGMFIPKFNIFVTHSINKNKALKSGDSKDAKKSDSKGKTSGSGQVDADQKNAKAPKTSKSSAQAQSALGRNKAHQNGQK